VLLVSAHSVAVLPSPFQEKQKQLIEGVVVDEKGAPIPAAVVTISAERAVAKTSTDDEGRFQLEPPAQPPVELVISARGFENIKQRINSAAATPTELRFVLRPATISEQVTITATRTETPVDETAASVIVIDKNKLQTTAALALDDALRQVPGFSLFRRSGSRTANPTTQGVSLRGLGASGASRALVLVDGVRLNDPFGGWVYWDRIPKESVAQVEVLQGGASHLYGGTALGGVVNLMTRRADHNVASLEVSLGNETTPDGSVFLGGIRNSWAGSLAAESFSTDGYIPVAPDARGLVDTAADSRHAVLDLNGERLFGPSGRVFAGASFFGEARGNGTPLQINRTHIRQFKLGGEWESQTVGNLAARVYGSTQVYDQTFSTISLDRNTETLNRVQRVPAQAAAAAIQWVRNAGEKQTLVAGFETREVRGASDEIAYANGRATSLIGSGGREFDVGAYFEDLVRLSSKLFLNVGLRGDRWRNYAALSTTKLLTGSQLQPVTLFPDRSETAFSPSASATYKVNHTFSLLISGMRAFRPPTLNELYRSFRVGNVLTLANENLRAERLTGGEAGVRINSSDGRVVTRGSFFWNDITRPVANVTLQTTPALITRQRQNLGRTRSRGVEIDAEINLNSSWNLSAGYLFADATVVRFPGNTALEGLMIPQVPRHQFTFQGRYANSSWVTIGIQGRASSSQFDDDQNLFRLGSYFVLDAFASRRLSHRFEIFIAAENLFDQDYEIGKTPVTTLGAPIQVRAGFRVSLGK